MTGTGEVEMHTPVVVTDGGPWALHDYACPTCQERKAVLNLNTGRFHPCWPCQDEGWTTVKAPKLVRRLVGRWRDR